MEAKLAIVSIDFFLFSSFLLSLSLSTSITFHPLRGYSGSWNFIFPQYFGVTRRNIWKKKNNLGNFFLRKKADFCAFFYTASVQSRSLDQPIVPGVFNKIVCWDYISGIKLSCLPPTALTSRTVLTYQYVWWSLKYRSCGVQVCFYCQRYL